MTMENLDCGCCVTTETQRRIKQRQHDEMRGSVRSLGYVLLILTGGALLIIGMMLRQ